MSEWISVKDAMPISDGEYLTYSTGYKDQIRNVVSLDWFAVEGRQVVWFNIRRGGSFGITHWMPLPEPPNKTPKYTK